MAKDNFNIDPKLEELSVKWLKNPQSRAFAPLADTYRKSGMLDEALQVCLDGLKIHPDYTSAHILLGKIYLDKQMIKEAEVEFNGVIEKDPDSLVTLNALGEIYYQQKRFLEALEKYERAKKLDPFNEEIKQKLTEVSRFCSQPVHTPVTAKGDQTPQPDAVDFKEESVSEVKTPPARSEEVQEVKAPAVVEEPAAKEPEKVFQIETEAPAVIKEEVVQKPPAVEEEPQRVFEVEASEAESAAGEPKQIFKVEVEAAVKEPTGVVEDEKVYDIGDEVEPLDQIEFPATPIPGRSGA